MMNVKIMGESVQMGVLNRLYNLIFEKFDRGQTSFGVPVGPLDVSQKRTLAREELADELNLLGCALLLTPNQQDGYSFEKGENEDAPFDELEFISKNSLTSRQYIANAKECIWELDEISVEDSETVETKFHSDVLSVKVLNLLQKQCAQVLFLTGDDAGGNALWLVKEPQSFVRAALLEKGRPADAFDEVPFDKDLSSIDIDYKEFLQNSDNLSAKEMQKADSAFNKEAQRLQKLIKKWEKSADKTVGERRSECIAQTERARKNLARGVDARRSALYEAFRAGVISEYYFDKRRGQLAQGDFSKVPDLFEADALKDRRTYLKEHDLQDLDKQEADNILAMAKRKAERDKNNFFTKRFLMTRGLASEKRYEISEMKIEEQLLYRGFVSERGFVIERGYAQNISEDKGARITIDEDEPIVSANGTELLQKEPERKAEPERKIEPLERRVERL